MFYRGTHQLNADGTVVTEDMDIEIVDTTANKSSMMMPGDCFWKYYTIFVDLCQQYFNKFWRLLVV